MLGIGMSPGRRQKLAGSMFADIAEIRRILDDIEQDVHAFDEDSEVIFALSNSHLAEACARLMYRAGEANGALMLPDLVDGKAAEAAERKPNE